LTTLYDDCCVLCYASRDERCHIFRENQLAMRSSEKYYQDLEEIEDGLTEMVNASLELNVQVF